MIREDPMIFVKIQASKNLFRTSHQNYLVGLSFDQNLNQDIFLKMYS